MANPLLGRSLTALAGLALAAATFAAGSLAIAYRSLPQADKGYGYVLGVMLALNSDHVEAIWAGKPAKIVFHNHEYDVSNKYIWQPITLRREGCLDVARALPAQCSTPHAVEPRNASRFFFSVDDKGAINIQVGSVTPGSPAREASGATYQVEGEIAIRRTSKSATYVKIDVSAGGLNLADFATRPDPNKQPQLEGDPEVGGCDKPRQVTLRDPVILRLLPATVARLCRFQIEDKSVLSLVQFQSGPLQYAAWSDAVMCRALLAEMLGRNPGPGTAGCLGAHWNEIERLDVRLALFDVTPKGEFAHIR